MYPQADRLVLNKAVVRNLVKEEDKRTPFAPYVGTRRQDERGLQENVQVDKVTCVYMVPCKLILEYNDSHGKSHIGPISRYQLRPEGAAPPDRFMRVSNTMLRSTDLPVSVSCLTMLRTSSLWKPIAATSSITCEQRKTQHSLHIQDTTP